MCNKIAMTDISTDFAKFLEKFKGHFMVISINCKMAVYSTATSKTLISSDGFTFTSKVSYVGQSTDE